MIIYSLNHHLNHKTTVKKTQIHGDDRIEIAETKINFNDSSQAYIQT